MKLNIKISALLSSILLMFSISCTSDFEEINKNPLYPDKEMEQLDGVLYSAYLPNLQKNVIPVSTTSENTDLVNAYQITINLAGDNWAGYMSPRDNKFDAGQNFTTYFFKESWVNLTFATRITNVFAPWIQLKNISLSGENPNNEIYALAQIVKIAALHRTTDMFGSIPYTKVGSGSFTVEYDSQETIYTSFFKELDEAIKVLTDFYGKGNSQIPLAKDVVYDGNTENWVRYANSLMLRLALRVRYAAPELSKTYAEKAANHPLGLISTIEQSAKMSRGAGLQMRHSLKIINDEYNDVRMGATIQCYLKGYNDPRMGAYFTNNGVNAVRTGIAQSGTAYDNASRPNIVSETPTYWLKASEVFFLKAEAALAGFNVGGTAKQFYEEGIRMSFEENGVNIGTYLTNTNRPAPFNDMVNPSYNGSAPSSITIAWNDEDNEETKLERIITQKYLAIFPDGQEAWTEWRRTGYPRLLPAKVNATNAGVITGDGHKEGVRRIPYPRTEYTQNKENLQKAIDLYLGGVDNAATNVWWDKKVKK